MIFRGREVMMNQPPCAVAYGWNDLGDTADLVIVFQQVGQSPTGAIAQTRAHFPNIEFIEMEDGGAFDASMDYGVEPPLQWKVIHFNVTPRGNLSLSSSQSDLHSALSSSLPTSTETFDALMQDVDRSDENDEVDG